MSAFTSFKASMKAPPHVMTTTVLCAAAGSANANRIASATNDARKNGLMVATPLVRRLLRWRGERGFPVRLHTSVFSFEVDDIIERLASQMPPDVIEEIVERAP